MDIDSDLEQQFEDAMGGDTVALQQLLLARYDALAGMIRTRIPASLRSVVDVDDVLQMTFVQVFKGISTFKDGNATAFFAWVRSIAEARLADAIRMATRQKRGGDWNRVREAGANASASYIDLLTLLADEDRRSPSRSAAAHEAVVALQVAVAGLPDDQREAIQLRYIECLTLDEVVQKMGRSEAAIRGLLHRGKATLKTSMGQPSTWFSQT